ncbi:TonB-dependent receptor [Olivibacter sp. SDN3]|nr:TonB-dependent receptor [Olivibacter sp. SDN3]
MFKEITQQTGYDVVYALDNLDEKGVISVTFRDAPLEEVLEVCLKGLPVTYVIKDKTILIKKWEQPAYDSSKVGGFAEIVDKRQNREISGTVVDQDGQALAGVSIQLKGTAIRTSTDQNGFYTLRFPEGDSVTLIFSSVGFASQEIIVDEQENLNVELVETVSNLDEVVVVGYGTQKRGDITGSIASLSADRLEGISNASLTQAIQGGIPGVSVQTTTAGAAPSESVMIRGRNSIKASNDPLVVVDGVAGSLGDVNPNDVLSVEVLKDASAAAIYGSRGSNGVILVTTKSGNSGETKLNYNGFYGMQRFANLPEMMTGEEFYQFKLEREPTSMTPSEQAVYDSGIFADWSDLVLRKGMSTNHNLSFSGGFKDTKFYISGDLLDIKGLAVNDKFKKITTRINVDTKLKNWLTIGTRTQLRYNDAGGISPILDGSQGAYTYNPLTTPLDENGNQNINPWPEYNTYSNPLMGLLADNIDESYQVVSNNYGIVDFPFARGLQYRINTGIRFGLANNATYYGRDTQRGRLVDGDASTSRGISRNIVIENIVNYNRDFGKHSVFLTGLYSFENVRNNTNSISAQGFPNDFLSWYGAQQASLIVPSYSNSETALISTMGRVNYSYDSRYLLTLTGRSDSYSGFGVKTKRGFFPSMALAWNIANEDFFKWSTIFSELKLRGSIGLNGNQAVSAYETISRLASQDVVAGSTTLPGYSPSKLGTENLGWESSRTLNIGLDFIALNNRISGDINVYKSNTFDLLLDRTISPVSAFTSITQNIGETENRGLEISLVSTNVSTPNFTWVTNGNIAFVKNKIVSLYGYMDENGNEIDDVANRWFIGQPIRVNYDYNWIGVWQLDEAAEAEARGTQPGFIKIQDVSGPDGQPDGILSPDYDRRIIGQRDPKFTWGMNNVLSYKNFRLSVFVYGMHGMTIENTLLSDAVGRTILSNTTKKNWWTPDNPTNSWYMNRLDANVQEGYTAPPYEKAGFIRLRDVSLSYDFSKNVIPNLGLGKLRVYVSGRNLHTFTKFGGLDPELTNQLDVPLQKEYTIGMNLEF